eukprot:gene18785-37848_t
MIQSFADPETERIWSGVRSRKLPSDIQGVAPRKLRLLNQARARADLRVPPGNRLERLRADRSGQYSIREDRLMSKSSTIMTDDQLLPNPTPGEILLEEFLKPMGLSQNEVARALHVPPRRINEIVLGKRSVTADTDLRLARYFGLSEGFFLGLQADFDLMRRRREVRDDLLSISPRADQSVARRFAEAFA